MSLLPRATLHSDSEHGLHSTVHRDKGIGPGRGRGGEEDRYDQVDPSMGHTGRGGQTALLVRWSAVRGPADYRNDSGPADW